MFRGCQSLGLELDQHCCSILGLALPCQCINLLQSLHTTGGTPGTTSASSLLKAKTWSQFSSGQTRARLVHEGHRLGPAGVSFLSDGACVVHDGQRLPSSVGERGRHRPKNGFYPLGTATTRVRCRRGTTGVSVAPLRQARTTSCPGTRFQIPPPTHDLFSRLGPKVVFGCMQGRHGRAMSVQSGPEGRCGFFFFEVLVELKSSRIIRGEGIDSTEVLERCEGQFHQQYVSTHVDTSATVPYLGHIGFSRGAHGLLHRCRICLGALSLLRYLDSFSFFSVSRLRELAAQDTSRRRFFSLETRFLSIFCPSSWFPRRQLERFAS